MRVSCPSCSTTYQVSDKLITTHNPTFRCSRCKHIFVLEFKNKTTTEEETSPLPPETRQEDEGKSPELDFSFPSTQADTTEHKAEEDPHPAETTHPPVTDSQDQEPSEAPIPESDEPPAREEESTEPTWADEQAALQSTTPDIPTHWKADSETEGEEESLPIQEEERANDTLASPRQSKGLSVIPYISLFGILLLIFSIVTLAYQARPAQLESLIKAVPWFGPMIIKNNQLRDGIVVRSLKSNFLTILGGRKVFVISGEIVNRTPVGVGEIRVEGQIYTEEGEEIESQAISIGNAISTKIIRDMTAREISILQRLSPQKRYEIPPDESAAFAIVFLKPTGTIKAFSCRVLSAKGAA